MKRALFAAATLLSVSATAVLAQPTTIVQSDAGNVLAAASNGMTLYTFRNDSPNQSNCYDSCAVAWPPFTAGPSATASGNLGIIERNDGTRQWTLDGQPLYFWQGDTQRGDATGDGVNGVWDVVRG